MKTNAELSMVVYSKIFELKKDLLKTNQKTMDFHQDKTMD